MRSHPRHESDPYLLNLLSFFLLLGDSDAAVASPKATAQPEALETTRRGSSDPPAGVVGANGLGTTLHAK
jgi:hypothetical protein